MQSLQHLGEGLSEQTVWKYERRRQHSPHTSPELNMVHIDIPTLTPGTIDHAITNSLRFVSEHAMPFLHINYTSKWVVIPESTWQLGCEPQWRSLVTNERVRGRLKWGKPWNRHECSCANVQKTTTDGRQSFVSVVLEVPIALQENKNYVWWNKPLQLLEETHFYSLHIQALAVYR